MNNKGFTLMEAMIVAVIIAIAAALAVPNMGGWMQRRAVNNEARRLASTLQLAKSEAVTRNTNVYLDLGDLSDLKGYALYYNSGGSTGAYKQLTPLITIDEDKILISSIVTSMGFNSRGLNLALSEISLRVQPKLGNPSWVRVIKVSSGGAITIEP